MHHGAPIIDTEVTELTARGPRYRGRWLPRDLIATSHTFEDVAELLWAAHETTNGARLPWPAAFTPSATLRSAGREILAAAGPESILKLFTLHALSASVEADPPEILTTARRIIRTLSGCVGYLSSSREFRSPDNETSVAEFILRACDLRTDSDSVRRANAILILLADDELAPATFIARVAASFRADLIACLICGIESSLGWTYEYRDVERLLRDITSRTELRQRVDAICREGKTPPGFGGELSRQNDTRTATFLQLSLSAASPSRATIVLADFLEKDAPRLNLQPRPILGLEILAKAMRLPRGAVPAFFVISRCAGWVAHIIEQSESNLSLRPRARFISQKTKKKKAGDQIDRLLSWRQLILDSTYSSSR